MLQNKLLCFLQYIVINKFGVFCHTTDCRKHLVGDRGQRKMGRLAGGHRKARNTHIYTTHYNTSFGDRYKQGSPKRRAGEPIIQYCATLY